MRILLTGGTGFIGSSLCRALSLQGHHLTVFSRRPEVVAKACGSGVSAMANLAEWTPGLHFDAVVNLAGEPIMSRRWNAARKRSLRDSRVTLTRRLVEQMARAERKPAVFISGSAVGVYGDQGDLCLNENSAGDGNGFGRQLCLEWEQAALQAETMLGIRVCLLRTGLVLSRHGGFLASLLLPFRLGLGGRIGDGRQWMSWIHLADHVALTQFLLDSPDARGPYNATAPNPVRNAEFTCTLSSLLKRPAVFHLPAWFLKLAVGEMAELLLASQRALPQQALTQEVRFRFETLAPALRDVLSE